MSHRATMNTKTAIALSQSGDVNTALIMERDWIAVRSRSV